MNGIIAIKESKFRNNIEWTTFDQETYRNKYVDGMMLRVPWRALYVDNAWSFQGISLLTDFESNAAIARKLCGLIITAGFDTPNFIKDRVWTENFTAVRLDEGVDNRLPIPWDVQYLNEWCKFLRIMVSDFGWNYIALSGPTSVSAEMSLPNDLQTWQAIGYTPEKYIAAWELTASIYWQLDLARRYSFALAPGLPLPTHDDRDNTRALVLDAVKRAFGKMPVLAVQTSGGSALKQADGYDIVKSLASTEIYTGFQFRSSATRHAQELAGTDDVVAAFDATVDNLLAPNDAGAIPDYLQIYEEDILNPVLQKSIARASQILKKGRQ